MLLSKDLALLTSKLEVPLVASDIVNGREALSDGTRYAIHENISDKQPDTALLAIAVSARFIASKYGNECTNLKILAMECDRIINEYGEIWLKNAQEQSIDEDKLFDVLLHTAEDLEGLAELLEYNYYALRDVNYEAAELCDILQIQAKTHAMVAEAFIEAADRMIAEHQESITATEVYTNNVIAFPAIRA